MINFSTKPEQATITINFTKPINKISITRKKKERRTRESTHQAFQHDHIPIQQVQEESDCSFHDGFTVEEVQL
jgi:hypothetical protein